MAHLHVVPDGRTWAVETETGRTVSQGHRKKAKAVEAMDRAANSGDTKYYHGSKGAILDVRTHQ